MSRFAFFTVIVGVATPTTWAVADETFFKEKVLPVLQQRCFECHSHEGGKAKGGLVLDSRSGWEVGGDSGPALVPGDAAGSLLIKAVEHTLGGFEMPPKGKIPAGEIDLLRQWIEGGAADPRAGGGGVVKAGVDIEAGRQFWSFRPLKKVVVPEVKDDSWPRNDIDRFIMAKLEERGLRPSPDATPEGLRRRLSYDLTGLPAPGNASSEIDSLIQELLSSRQFGEKWGRHWLDLARYADSNGSSFNPPFPMAWRYRNWVIEALNSDMSYRDFLMKQLAGDLMKAGSQEERDANLIATGYLMLGSKVLGEFDKEQLLMDVVDEQVDTLGKTFMGMTLGCARCHDHKFDPVPQTDYYAIAGMFTSTVTLEDRMGGPKEDESDWSRRGLGEGNDEKLQAFLKENRYAWAKSSAKAYRKLTDKNYKAKEGEPDPVEVFQELEKQRPPYAEAVRDQAEPADTHLRIRGVPGSLGQKVPRGYLQVASYEGQPAVNREQSGRLQLAEWLASERNPLTARVTVNRIWKHLFGEGLVRSLDNFGTTGDLPSHPELLDYLAQRFMDEGWKLKPLIAEIVSSRTYQMSTQHQSLAAHEDPENKLLWRQNRRRLEPEEIRDTLMLLAGQLNLNPAENLLAYTPFTDLQGADAKRLETRSFHRTIYQPIIRTMERDEYQIFDFAPTAMSTGQRPQTTVAPQALYFMNAPFVQEMSQFFAERIASHRQGVILEPVVRAAFSAAVGRQPYPKEEQLLKAYLDTQFEGPPGPTVHDLGKLCQAIIGSTQFQFLD